MKKLFFALICLTLPFFSNAQRSGGETQLGFTASPNVGWLSGEDAANDGSRVGVAYGVMADLAFSSNYYFATGLTITSVNGRSASNDGSSNYKLRYIEVPLTLKLKSQPTSLGRYYGQFGLGTGYKIGAKADVTEGIGGQKTKDVDVSSDVNFFRLSMIAGAGIEWETSGDLNVMTGITYNNGFTNTIDGKNVKNSYIALTLGVFF